MEFIFKVKSIKIIHNLISKKPIIKFNSKVFLNYKRFVKKN